MTQDKKRQERRKESRVKKNIPIKLFIPEEYDAIAETKNISASGAYCILHLKIPEMTKLAIILLIPSYDRIPAKKIECKGVVVRIEENKSPKNKPYNIAIYFNNINKSDKKFIRQYVKHHLNKKS